MEDRLGIDAAGGSGIGRHAEEHGLALDGVNGEVDGGGVDGVAFEGAEIGHCVRELQQFDAGGDALAHIVGKRFCTGGFEYEVRDLGGFSGSDWQIEQAGGHERLSVRRYSRKGGPRSSRLSASSTVALRKPSLSPAS